MGDIPLWSPLSNLACLLLGNLATRWREGSCRSAPILDEILLPRIKVIINPPILFSFFFEEQKLHHLLHAYNTSLSPQFQKRPKSLSSPPPKKSRSPLDLGLLFESSWMGVIHGERGGEERRKNNAAAAELQWARSFKDARAPIPPLPILRAESPPPRWRRKETTTHQRRYCCCCRWLWRRRRWRALFRIGRERGRGR